MTQRILMLENLNFVLDQDPNVFTPKTKLSKKSGIPTLSVELPL